MKVSGSRPEERQEALLGLALLLEWNSMPDESRRINRSDYELTLSGDLLDLDLSRRDKREIVRRLHETYEAGWREPSVLWAIGKSQLLDGFASLLELLLSTNQELDEETAFQGASALQRYTWRMKFSPKEKSKQKLMEVLERLAGIDSSRVDEVRALIVHDLERRTEPAEGESR